MNQRPYDDVRALANLLAESPEPMVVVALDGTIVHWNTAATELFGISAREAEGQPCWVMVAGRTATAEPVRSSSYSALQEARAGRSPGPAEVVITRRQTGQRHVVMVHHLTLNDTAGQPRGVAHLLEDVDQRRRRERVGERVLALLAGQGNIESSLTPREHEVLRLLADGRTAREVAERLGIQYTTARNHIQHILSKLGVHNRVAALARALTGDETS